MNTIKRLAPVPLTLLFTLLAGCQTATAPTAEQPAAPAPAATAAADAGCNVTAASWAHIQTRHCMAGGGTRFQAGYCTQPAQQQLCQNVQAAQNKTRVVQPDGRVRYDANLGVAVGMGGEKCVRLITTSPTNGVVVTQFPEDSNAPGNCL